MEQQEEARVAGRAGVAMNDTMTPFRGLLGRSAGCVEWARQAMSGNELGGGCL